MSLLFPDQITIWVTKTRVDIYKLDRKNPKNNQRVLSEGLQTDEKLEATIERAIKRYRTQETGATQCHAIISNALVYYQRFDSSRELSDFEEENVFVQSQFKRVFGVAAESWAFTWESGIEKRPVLAAAMPLGLLSSIENSCAIAGLDLRNVHPYFMYFFNRIRNALDANISRIILIEGGEMLCAEIQNDEWCRLHKTTLLADSPDAIAVQINRESLLSDLELSPDQIILLTSMRVDETQSMPVGQNILCPPEDFFLNPQRKLNSLETN